MSVKYSLILKKDSIKIPMMINDEKVSEISSLSFIDHATSFYTNEKLFYKYFSNSNIDPLDNEFCIRYYYQKLRELPCIFNDKYIFLITNPELKFFVKEKEQTPNTIWDNKDIANADSLFYESILKNTNGILPLKLNKYNQKKENNLYNLVGIMSKKDPSNASYRINYAIVAKKPSKILANLFIKLYDNYRYDFEDFYNKEIVSISKTDPLSEYKTKATEANTYNFIDYFKRDKNDPKKLSSEMFYAIEDDLTNYKRFRTCYYIVKKFCIKEIGMKEQNFIDIFYQTINIIQLDTFKVEPTYEQTSLFKK